MSRMRSTGYRRGVRGKIVERKISWAFIWAKYVMGDRPKFKKRKKNVSFIQQRKWRRKFVRTRISWTENGKYINGSSLSHLQRHLPIARSQRERIQTAVEDHTEHMPSKLHPGMKDPTNARGG